MSETPNDAPPVNNVLELPTNRRGFRTAKQPTKREVMSEFEKLVKVEEKTAMLYSIAQQLARANNVMADRLNKLEQTTDAFLSMLDCRLVALMKVMLDKKLATEEELTRYTETEQLNFIKAQEPAIDTANRLITIDRPAQDNDLVIISIASYEESGNKIPEMSSLWFMASLGAEVRNFQKMLPDLTTAVIGMSTGDKKTITTTLPEDYFLADVAGKTIKVDLELLRVKYQAPETLPEEPKPA